MIRNFMLCVAAAMIALAAWPAEANDCADIGMLFKKLDTSRAVQLRATGSGGKTYKQLYDDCDRTNTFNGRPIPRKCSTDANMVKGVWKFPDGTIVFVAKASVDADGSPLAQSGTGTNQSETTLKWDDTRKSVDAEAVSFIVVPLPRAGVSFSRDSGIELGDLDVAIRDDKCSAGVVADRGPGFRLGEGSLRMHEDLGNPQCVVPNQVPCMKIVGGGSGRGLRSIGYVVFPRSKPSPLNASDVRANQAMALARVTEFLTKFQRKP